MELASTQSDLSQLVAMTLTNPAMLDTPVINEVKQHWTTMGGREATWELLVLLVLLEIVAA